MTPEEHDNFYGFTPDMTPEQRRARQQEIMKTATYFGDIDEDTPDFEGYKVERE